MPQIDLLRSLPKTKRSRKILEERRRVKEAGDDQISRLFGYDYFDGPRDYGYGGYYLDNRWDQVSIDFINHYKLRDNGDKILDVGCAKGFLVYAFRRCGMDAYGIDVSRYAVRNCPSDIVGRIHSGDVMDLPFPDNSFDLVTSINCIHNLHVRHIPLALKEIQRVSRQNCFITVDSYETEEQRKDFEDWQLTCRTHMYPEEWIALFERCGYTGDYDFTILELEDG